ncbi:hypothetical protein [Paenibacillus donghaensis]|uniref:Uncharacterized protein n=1 Tax=Paenibacillus donghaensis TaxID=414771 RepID=A0A2Z2KK81_9BACL|nr:hypothetical protein [Paenibacillus donghaensis]ASA20251.1 hypothetical protein B9T62_05210 [Paenibacillus donghaensis]
MRPERAIQNKVTEDTFCDLILNPDVGQGSGSPGAGASIGSLPAAALSWLIGAAPDPPKLQLTLSLSYK